MGTDDEPTADPPSQQGSPIVSQTQDDSDPPPPTPSLTKIKRRRKPRPNAARRVSRRNKRRAAQTHALQAELTSPTLEQQFEVDHWGELTDLTPARRTDFWYPKLEE